jgi:phage tail sheath protein FI
MPTALSHPGVYLEELPGGARPIAGVSTSNTAFVGFFTKGSVDRPTAVDSFEAVTARYGGLDARSEAAYGLLQYFVNGGQRAFVLRVAPGSAPSTLVLTDGTNDIVTVDAIDPGEWGDQLQVGVEVLGGTPAVFNLVVRRIRTVDGRDRVVAAETHLNLSMDEGAARYAPTTVDEASDLVRLTDAGHEAGQAGRALPAQTAAGISFGAVINDVDAAGFVPLANGADGDVPDAAALQGALPLLDQLAPQVFNMLCIPAMATLDDAGLVALVGAANTFCRDRRAFLFVDPPSTVDAVDDMTDWMNDHGALRDRNNAVFFPPLQVSDPLAEGRPRRVPPSGTLAGIYARTDGERGVWKAAAGTEARIRGATIVGAPVTDAGSGVLNPLGVNVLRSFPVFGDVVWGARTGDGADQLASEWKYAPVRRTALYIEESLLQGLRWVVFEPNDEPLWAQIRLNVGGFMQTLFRKGAFQGRTPNEAYLVRCDRTTTTQTDIDNGVVNILVGFAPLRPAEFVVIQIQQLTAQAAA